MCEAQHTLVFFVAVTVATRGRSVSKEISPKYCPGPRVPLHFSQLAGMDWKQLNEGLHFGLRFTIIVFLGAYHLTVLNNGKCPAFISLANNHLSTVALWMNAGGSYCTLRRIREVQHNQRWVASRIHSEMLRIIKESKLQKYQYTIMGHVSGS